jgi:hypothetical protein
VLSRTLPRLLAYLEKPIELTGNKELLECECRSTRGHRRWGERLQEVDICTSSIKEVIRICTRTDANKTSHILTVVTALFPKKACIWNFSRLSTATKNPTQVLRSSVGS